MIHLHVVPMHSVDQEQELELALVSLDILVIHTLPADQSVSSILTVLPTELVSIINVWIHVQEFVV